MLDNVPINGATSRTLTVSEAGAYKVAVTSTLGGSSLTRSSNDAIITINAGSITAQPESNVISDGEITYLNVGFTSSMSFVVEYQWLRNGTEVDGATNLSYGARVAGEYRLRITTSHNGATSVQYTDTATVTVVPRPVITSFAASPSTILTGNATTLDAVFTNGTGVVTPGNITVSSGVGTSVSPSTTTTYTLTVTNAAGTTESRNVTVTVTTGTVTASANNSSASRYRNSSAVTLNDGRVLVFGGNNNDTAISDIYDPATNRFTRTGDMNQSRGDAPGFLLPNGKVLTVGGVYLASLGWSARDTAELFDPTTNTWSYAASPSTSRKDYFSVLLNDGKVMIGGGSNAAGATLSSVEIYDPMTGQFSLVANLPSGRQEATAAVLPNGNVIVVGGMTNNTTSASAVVYDIASNAWSTVASHMNYARRGALAITLNDGRVLVAGGFYGAIGEGHLEIYDPATNTFAPAFDMTSFSIGRGGMTGHLLANGKVVFFGGNDGYGNDLNEIVVYNPTGNGLTVEATTLSVHRYTHASTLLNDGRVFIIGGNYWNSTNADIFAE
jgi:N-acetylneuraminic acid mutarotase